MYDHASVCDALHYLLDKYLLGLVLNYIDKSLVCVLIVPYLLQICFRDFMLSLYDKNQADDLLNIDNPYFEQRVSQIYPAKLQFNKAHLFDTEAPFLDFDVLISNCIISSKLYDKWEDFEIVNFPFLDGDIPYAQLVHLLEFVQM